MKLNTRALFFIFNLPFILRINRRIKLNELSEFICAHLRLISEANPTHLFLLPFRTHCSQLTGVVLSTVYNTIIDSPNQTSISTRPHGYNPAKVQELYQGALTALRKNP